jgi:hypothetical protein
MGTRVLSARSPLCVAAKRRRSTMTMTTTKYEVGATNSTAYIFRSAPFFPTQDRVDRVQKHRVKSHTLRSPLASRQRNRDLPATKHPRATRSPPPPPFATLRISPLRAT